MSEEPLLPASAEAFLPMPAPKTMTTPPRGLVFADLASGEAPLIYQPEGTYEKPAITQALQSMLTVGPVMGITNPNTWEDLLAAAGAGTADVFVVDRRGERYKVIDVLFDFGGESGELRLRHLGRRSRQGDLYVDLERAFGYMIPIVVYKSRQSFRKNPPYFRVRSPRQGLRAIKHPLIVKNRKKAHRFKPKHKKAVLVPCAGTKPFPEAPSHKHGYLKGLKGKKLDLFVVSEPLGIVPYAWSREYPQTGYDFPPKHLRGAARAELVDRIGDWFCLVAPKYQEVYLALPGHHLRLVNDALARFDPVPTKITDVGLGACLEDGSCPTGHVRPTTKSYRSYLKRRVRSNPDERMRRLGRSDDPIAARIERIRRGVEPVPPLEFKFDNVPAEESYVDLRRCYPGIDAFGRGGIPSREEIQEIISIQQELGLLPQFDSEIRISWDPSLGYPSFRPRWSRGLNGEVVTKCADLRYEFPDPCEVVPGDWLRPTIYFEVSGSRFYIDARLAGGAWKAPRIGEEIEIDWPGRVRNNPDERMRRLERGRDPIAARIERIRRGVEPRPPLYHFVPEGASPLGELDIPTSRELAEDLAILQELGFLPSPGEKITLRWSPVQARRAFRAGNFPSGHGYTTEEWLDNDRSVVVVDRVYFEFAFTGEDEGPPVFLIPHVDFRFPGGGAGGIRLWPLNSGGYGVDPDFVPGWVYRLGSFQVRVEEYDPYNVNHVPLEHRSFMQRFFGLEEDPFDGLPDPVEGS